MVAWFAAWLGAIEVNLANVFVVVLLVWASVRLHRADARMDRVRGAVGDPLVAVAGGGCLVASIAMLVWIGGVRMLMVTALFPVHSGGSPCTSTSLCAIPAATLGAAAVARSGDRRGGRWPHVSWSPWSAPWSCCSLAGRRCHGSVGFVMLTLLILVGSAYTRLRRMAGEQIT